MYHFIRIVYVLSSTLSINIMGFLLSGPVDTIAREGETVLLNCRSNLSATVKWILGHPGTNNIRNIFEATSDKKGYIYSYFKKRFSCFREEHGSQNLVIKNVSHSDTGNYTCIDDEGFGYVPERSSYGRWKSASLVVVRSTHLTESSLYLNDNTSGTTQYFYENTIEFADVHAAHLPVVIGIVFVIVFLAGVVGVLLHFKLCQNREQGNRDPRTGTKTSQKQPKPTSAIEDESESSLVKKSIMTDKREDGQDENDARLFLAKPKLLGMISGRGCISGITVLNQELFVVRCGSKRVHVYSALNYAPLTRNITINTNSSDLDNIAASTRDNCLYISDVGMKIIHRYFLSSSALTKWPVDGKVDGEVDGECHGLSVTSTFNVLVTLSHTNHLKEYSPEGSLIRKIKLHSSIEYPWHSVQLPDGQLVVSHGWQGTLHQVCTVLESRMSGIHFYGGSKGSGLNMLNYPGNLAVDSCGNVFVADNHNNRVVLLSPSLTHLGYITVPGQDPSDQWALHFDQINRRLYIGEYTNTGRVFILGVT